MMFKLVVKTITLVVEFVLTAILLIMLTAFAMKPTEISLFTDSLILVMIMVQLYSVNVLLDLYDKLEVKKR
jgi:hypothetical protein